MLLVKPSGAKSWVLRYQVVGKRHDLGLGPYPEISLAEARERALEERRRILAGRDPIVERKRAGALTFEAAAEALIESKRAGWRNAKHAAQWSATLRTYVYPALGSLNVLGHVLPLQRGMMPDGPYLRWLGEQVRDRPEVCLRTRAPIVLTK